jgi:hypothetical protein
VNEMDRSFSWRNPKRTDVVEHLDTAAALLLKTFLSGDWILWTQYSD